MRNKYSEEELASIEDTAKLLERYRFSDVFGDVSGALQKVIDIIRIDLSREEYGNYNFIYPEKIIHNKGSEHLIVLIDAIKNKQCLRIYYHPFYEEKPYFSEIHPYLLKEYKNRWYLIGLHDFKKQLRTYSLDRIRNIEPSDIEYKETNIDKSAYFKHAVGIISPQGQPPLVRIQVQKTQAQYIITQPWHESQNIEEEGEEDIIFSFRVHPTYEFIQLILSFGKDIKVLEPLSLQRTIKAELERMISLYD